jgi:hypothetical protein
LEDEVSRRAFKQLKSALQVAPILQTPDWNKPFVVYCDASGEAVGSTLSQLDGNGHDHPIHFASRQLTSAEKNYTVTEQEGLAVIFSQVSPLFVGVQGQNCDRSQGLNLLGQQAQSKWSTCSMVAFNGGI